MANQLVQKAIFQAKFVEMFADLCNQLEVQFKKAILSDNSPLDEEVGAKS